MIERLVAPENDYSALAERVVDSPWLQVCVVIPVYNRVDLLSRTVAGIASQTYPHDLLRLIIADDGSDEDVTTAVAEFAGAIDIQILRREHDGYGAGQARNLGAEAADDEELLVFFDSDCIPDSHALSRHAAWHHLASNLVVIGSRHHLDTTEVSSEQILSDPQSLRDKTFGTRTPDESVWNSSDFRQVLHRRTSSLRFGDEAYRSLVSSNFSVMRSRFAEAGGFSEDFTRWGGEDTELGWRLWNQGDFFVDEPRAAIYHQVQTDSGPSGWREDARRANDGLIQSKIPHRFYRSQVNAINECPKVSVVVHSVEARRLEELCGQLLNQRLGDLEIVLTGTFENEDDFLERRHGDPRFKRAETIEDAFLVARGEFVALVHGSAAYDHRLLSRSVAAIERRPRAGAVRSAYGVRHESGTDIFRSERDLTRLDRDWGGLPIFLMARRRDLMKNTSSGADVAQTIAWIDEHVERQDHGIALVWLPSAAPTVSAQVSVRPPPTLKSAVVEDLRAGGQRALAAPFKAVRSVALRRPYDDLPTEPVARERPPVERRPVIRYVGWTGRNNMGDEAMFDAITELFDWADLETSGDTGDVLMLGGGTLINRGYLRLLRPLDSPRRERVAFGTGVANPAYWGEPKESVTEWVAFLASCAYVGVRGPSSAELLDAWGLRTEVEVIGDPALSLRAGAGIDRVEGRIVVCPAWSRGELWGGDDDRVITAFADTVRALREAGHDVWALSAFPADDTHLISMMRRADAPDLPYLAAHDDPQAALDLMATAELVVAERLHAAVLAAAVGTLPVMVEYRPKLRDFARSVSLEELVLRTDQLDDGALVSLTLQSFENRNVLAGTMNNQVALFRARQLQAAERVAAVVRG